MRITHEFRLVVAKVLEDQRRKVSIFTEMQQVFHVQGVHSILRITLDDLIRNEKRLVRIGRS